MPSSSHWSHLNWLSDRGQRLLPAHLSYLILIFSLFHPLQFSDTDEIFHRFLLLRHQWDLNPVTGLPVILSLGHISDVHCCSNYFYLPNCPNLSIIYTNDFSRMLIRAHLKMQRINRPTDRTNLCLTFNLNHFHVNKDSAEVSALLCTFGQKLKTTHLHTQLWVLLLCVHIGMSRLPPHL